MSEKPIGLDAEVAADAEIDSKLAKTRGAYNEEYDEVDDEGNTTFDDEDTKEGVDRLPIQSDVQAQLQVSYDTHALALVHYTASAKFYEQYEKADEIKEHEGPIYDTKFLLLGLSLEYATLAEAYEEFGKANELIFNSQWKINE